MPERRRGPFTDGRLNRRYTQVFRVYTGDALFAGLAVIALTPNLPKLGAIYQCDTEYDTGVEVISLAPEAETADDPTLWLVTVEYSNQAGDLQRYTAGQGSNPGGEGGGGLNENPLSQPPRLSWGRVADRDVLYKPLAKGLVANSFDSFVNAAGTPFRQYPEAEKGRVALTMVRNEVVYDPTFMGPYWDTLNRDSIFGAAAEQVKLDFTTGEYAKTNKIQYAVVTYQFSFRKDWLWHPANRGPKYRPAAGQPAVDEPTRGEVKLKADGTKAADADAPVLLDFNMYEVKNWEPLKLPERYLIP